jgi:hypothetical protein
MSFAGAIVLSLIPVVLHAGGLQSPVPSVLRSGTMGELSAIYIPRSEATIKESLEFARDLEKTSADGLSESKRLATEADGRLQIINEELRTSTTRRDVAKKTKQQAQRQELDAAIKQQQRERDYVKEMKEAIETDSERLDSDRAAAAAYVKALELELDVARRQAEIGSDPAPLVAASYREMVRKMLEAQRDAADLWTEAGKRREAVAERKLHQLGTLDKVSAGK